MSFPSFKSFVILVGFMFVIVASMSGVHLPIYRRGGRFARHELANITALDTIITHAEQKYSGTYTDLEGNRIVRRWREESKHGDRHMLDEAGLDGTWYTRIRLGEPPQSLEFDLDMLSPDFYTVMTTSNLGSRYDTFKSTTHEQTTVHFDPVCHESSDIFHLSDQQTGVPPSRLIFPLCQAPKSSRHTLAASGSIIGLAPPSPKSLSNLATSNIIRQLWDQHRIEYNMFSIAVLDGESGVLSIGDTIATEVETVKIRQEVEFKYLGQPDSSAKKEEIDGALDIAIPSGSNHNEHFKWTDVGNGAAGGWHMTLVTGIWVNGIKILKNQPVLIDLNCPVILSPPQAAERMYESMSGTKRLSTLIDGQDKISSARERFWTFPCLNTVNLEFEIAGWRYPVTKGGLREDDIHGPAGGRFSLGKVDLASGSINTTDISSGYCLGLVVESATNSKTQMSGMEDIWVLGEPFFRGLGITFDLGDERGNRGQIGLRTY